MTVTCLAPTKEDYPDRTLPPEEYGPDWRSESGECSHPYCLEGQAVGRLYRWANPKREVVVEEGPGYVVTAELAP